jgi:hypothetical protein
MAESSQVKTLGHGTVTIEDGTTPTAKSYTLTYEEGDLSITDVRYDSNVVHDRYDIAGETKGAQQPGEMSLTVKFRQFANTTSSEDTLIDVIDQTNNWSSAVSTGGSGYESFLHKVTVTVEGTDLGDQADHTWTFGKVKLDYSYQEGDPYSTVTVTGIIYSTGVRAGQGT